MPLTHIIKNVYLPTHTLISTNGAIGLKVNSIVEGEQNRVIDKCRIIRKLGKITNPYTKIEIVKVYFANTIGRKYISDELREEIMISA